MGDFANEHDTRHPFLFQQVALDDVAHLNAHENQLNGAAMLADNDDNDEMEGEEDEIQHPPIPLLQVQHIEELPELHNDQGALGLDIVNNDLPQGQPHDEDNVLDPAPFGEPLPPDQGEDAFENPVVQAGLEMPEQFFIWPEADLQHFFIGNWLEPDLGGQLFAGQDDDMDLEEWEAGEEVEETTMWTNFGLL